MVAIIMRYTLFMKVFTQVHATLSKLTMTMAKLLGPRRVSSWLDHNNQVDKITFTFKFMLFCGCQNCFPDLEFHQNAILLQVSIFEWYKARLVVQNNHPKDTSYNNNGLFVQNKKTILGSIPNYVIT